MLVKFVTPLYETFVCPDGALPLTRKSTAGPLGIACTKWICGLVRPSSLPTSSEPPPHALSTDATAIMAAMVRISFIVVTYLDVGLSAHSYAGACSGLRHQKPCSATVRTVSLRLSWALHSLLSLRAAAF